MREPIFATRKGQPSINICALKTAVIQGILKDRSIVFSMDAASAKTSWTFKTEEETVKALKDLMDFIESYKSHGIDTFIFQEGQSIINFNAISHMEVIGPKLSFFTNKFLERTWWVLKDEKEAQAKHDSFIEFANQS